MSPNKISYWSLFDIVIVVVPLCKLSGWVVMSTRWNRVNVGSHILLKFIYNFHFTHRYNI
jgi:hypothetical protein